MLAERALWQQRAFAHVPMSWVDNFTGQGPGLRELSLLGYLQPVLRLYTCVCQEALIGHGVTGGPCPAACSTVP